MPDFLEEKRKEISQRLKELRPLVDEYHRLEAAEQALSGVGGTAARAPRPPPTARARRAGAPRKGSGTGRRGRPQAAPAPAPSRRSSW